MMNMKNLPAAAKVMVYTITHTERGMPKKPVIFMKIFWVCRSTM